MPKKMNPIVRVLEYFETVALGEAVQALVLVRRTLALRESHEAEAAATTGVSRAQVKRRKPRRTKAQMQAAAAPTVASGPPVSLRPPRVSTSTHQAKDENEA